MGVSEYVRISLCEYMCEFICISMNVYLFVCMRMRGCVRISSCVCE